MNVVTCHYCCGTKIIKGGKRKDKSGLDKQIYRCLSCKRRFTEESGYFLGRQEPDLVVLYAFELYALSAFSLAEVQEKLLKELGVKVTRTTIMRWGNFSDERIEHLYYQLEPQKSEAEKLRKEDEEK